MPVIAKKKDEKDKKKPFKKGGVHFAPKDSKIEPKLPPKGEKPAEKAEKEHKKGKKHTKGTKHAKAALKSVFAAMQNK